MDNYILLADFLHLFLKVVFMSEFKLVLFWLWFDFYLYALMACFFSFSFLLSTFRCDVHWVAKRRTEIEKVRSPQSLFSAYGRSHLGATANCVHYVSGAYHQHRCRTCFATLGRRYRMPIATLTSLRCISPRPKKFCQNYALSILFCFTRFPPGQR